MEMWLCAQKRADACSGMACGIGMKFWQCCYVVTATSRYCTSAGKRKTK